MADQTYDEKIAKFEAKELAERLKRREFLKDATPTDVLYWIMRAPDMDAKLQAYCAKALLLHGKKDAIDPPEADKS